MRGCAAALAALACALVCAPAWAADDYASAVRSTPGLTGYWRLGEPTSSSQIRDEISGATGWATGLGAPGATDDGDGAWSGGGGSIYAGRSGGDLTTTFTVEAWALTQASAARQVLVANAPPDDGSSYVVLEPDGRLSAQAVGEYGRSAANSEPVALNRWHHIALSVGTDGFTLYVDGEPAAVTTARPNSGWGWSTLNFGTDWAGSLDEIALYSRPLDAATVRAHARIGQGGDEAPHTAFAIAPAALSNRASAEFRLTTGNGGASFACALDGGAWQPCSAVSRFAGLADGAHQLFVRSTDRFGIAEASPVSYAWRVDTVRPRTLAAMKIAMLDGAPAVASFTSEPGARFECQRSDGVAPIADPDDPTRWFACTPGIAITGKQNFSVRAVDAAGNRDPTPVTMYPLAWQGTLDGVVPFAGGAAEIQILGEPGRQRFDCRLNDAAWTSCRYRVRLPALPSGRQAFLVRQHIDGTDVVLQTPPLVWSATPAATGPVELVGAQFPLVVELSPGLRRRAPRLRFALNRPARVKVAVVRRGGRTAGRLQVEGHAGANAVKLPGAIVRRLRPGRYRLDIVARGTSGSRARAVVPFAALRRRR